LRRCADPAHPAVGAWSRGTATLSTSHCWTARVARRWAGCIPRRRRCSTMSATPRNAHAQVLDLASNVCS